MIEIDSITSTSFSNKIELEMTSKIRGMVTMAMQQKARIGKITTIREEVLRRSVQLNNLKAQNSTKTIQIMDR